MKRRLAAALDRREPIFRRSALRRFARKLAVASVYAGKVLLLAAAIVACIAIPHVLFGGAP